MELAETLFWQCRVTIPCLSPCSFHGYSSVHWSKCYLKLVFQEQCQPHHTLRHTRKSTRLLIATSTIFRMGVFINASSEFSLFCFLWYSRTHQLHIRLRSIVNEVLIEYQTSWWLGMEQTGSSLWWNDFGRLGIQPSCSHPGTRDVGWGCSGSLT